MKPYCLILLLACTIPSVSQPTINNLVHPPTYRTGVWGALGEVKKFGSGTQDVILLAGWGFDHSVFLDFIARHEKAYRMWAVTFPGFGKTQAPPMPAEPENYRDLNWTRGILKGLEDLIVKEKIDRPVIISLFSYSNLIAMRMALDYPEKVGKIVIVSGIAKFTANDPSYEPRSLDARCRYIEKGLAPHWFKTVTQETWNKGNFSAGTFSKDSLRGARHWEMMSSVPIHVMVRYLCEFYCTDLSLEYASLTVPVLVLIPGFTPGFLSKPEHNYAAPFFHYSWLGALPANSKIQMLTLSEAHTFMMDDQPVKFDAILNEFISGKLQAFPPVR